MAVWKKTNNAARYLLDTRLSPFPADYAHIDFLRLESNSLEIGPSATGKKRSQRGPKLRTAVPNSFPWLGDSLFGVPTLWQRKASPWRKTGGGSSRPDAGLGHIWSDRRASWWRCLLCPCLLPPDHPDSHPHPLLPDLPAPRLLFTMPCSV